MTTWCGAACFAEVAEALGVPTDRVAAVRVNDDGTLLVAYGERPETWEARAGVFARDADGVLVKHSEHELPRGFLEDLTRRDEGE